MPLRLLVTIFLLVCLPVSARACDFEDDDGLDVGLVISGGGAKASTQVGVMQLLDELDIPIHCIAGTSMGAVVGSFYANGYTSDEISDLLTDQNWGEKFRSLTERRDKSFIQKERDQVYKSGDLFGYNKDGIVIPGGVSSMQELKILYRDILRDVPLDSNFDHFSIPFRAVATELDTGEAVAFNKGDIVDTILASMAVPGIFPPREINGVAYVDGGIAANLPIQTIKDMGADIIIALDTTAKPQKADRQYSLADTVNQLTTIMVWGNVRKDIELLSSEDIYIRPDTIGIRTAGYDRSAEGIKAGYQEALKYKAAFEAIKLRAAPKHPPQSKYQNNLEATNLLIINPTSIKDNILKKRMGKINKLRDKGYDKNRRLRDLASFGGFGEVDLSYLNDEAALRVAENPLGKNRIRVGLNAASDFEGSSIFSVLGEITRQPLSSYGGDISLSAEFGTNIGLGLELYQPFGPSSRFFFQPQAFLRWNRREYDIGETRIGDFWVRNYGLRGRLGRELSQWGVLALEGNIAQSRTTPITTFITDFEEENSKTAKLGLYFAADTLNKTDWPTSGFRVSARAQKVLNLDDKKLPDANRFEIAGIHASEIDNIGFILNARYGKIDTEYFDFSTFFNLGGFRQLGSYRKDSLPLDNFQYGSIEIFKRLTPSDRLLNLPFYIGGIGEYGHFQKSIFQPNDNGDVISGTLYIGSDTPFGPVFLGTAYGNNDDLKLFFKFGRTF